MANRLSSKLINLLIEKRSFGWSLHEIRRKYKVGYGTIYRYTKNIEILPEYIQEWKYKRKGSIVKMNNDIKQAKNQAKRFLKSISNKEKQLFLAALYWAEGTKSDLSIINSDPDLISIFYTGLINDLNVPPEKIKISIRIFENMKKEKCINFWSKKLNINKNLISHVDVLTGKKINKLPYGLCRIRVLKGGTVLKYLKALRDRYLALHVPVVQRIERRFPKP